MAMPLCLAVEIDYSVQRRLSGLKTATIAHTASRSAMPRTVPPMSFRQMLCMRQMIRRRLFAAECCCPV